jgi:Domain of unknown function (DUF4232)
LCLVAGIVLTAACSSTANQNATPPTSTTFVSVPTTTMLIPRVIASYGTSGTPCDPRRLTVGEDSEGGPGAGGGHSSVEFVITNTGHATCSMFGYPTISFVDAHGHPLAFHYQHNDGFFVTHSPPRSVLIPAGASAYAAAEKYRCDLGEKSLGRTTQVRLPGNPHVYRVGISRTPGYCGPNDPGDIVIVTPIEPTQRALSQVY